MMGFFKFVKKIGKAAVPAIVKDSVIKFMSSRLVDRQAQKDAKQMGKSLPKLDKSEKVLVLSAKKGMSATKLRKELDKFNGEVENELKKLNSIVYREFVLMEKDVEEPKNLLVAFLHVLSQYSDKTVSGGLKKGLVREIEVLRSQLEVLMQEIKKTIGISNDLWVRAAAGTDIPSEQKLANMEEGLKILDGFLGKKQEMDSVIKDTMKKLGDLKEKLGDYLKKEHKVDVNVDDLAGYTSSGRIKIGVWFQVGDKEFMRKKIRVKKSARMNKGKGDFKVKWVWKQAGHKGNGSVLKGKSIEVNLLVAKSLFDLVVTYETGFKNLVTQVSERTKLTKQALGYCLLLYHFISEKVHHVEKSIAGVNPKAAKLEDKIWHQMVKDELGSVSNVGLRAGADIDVSMSDLRKAAAGARKKMLEEEARKKLNNTERRRRLATGSVASGGDSTLKDLGKVAAGAALVAGGITGAAVLKSDVGAQTPLKPGDVRVIGHDEAGKEVPLVLHEIGVDPGQALLASVGEQFKDRTVVTDDVVHFPFDASQVFVRDGKKFTLNQTLANPDSQEMFLANLTLALKKAQQESGLSEADFYARKNLKIRFKITGYSSEEGATYYNVKLSGDRAKSVELMLTAWAKPQDGRPRVFSEFEFVGGKGETGSREVVKEILKLMSSKKGSNKKQKQLRNKLGNAVAGLLTLTDAEARDLNGVTPGLLEIIGFLKKNGYNSGMKIEAIPPGSRPAKNFVDTLGPWLRENMDYLLAPHRKVVIAAEITYKEKIPVTPVVVVPLIKEGGVAKKLAPMKAILQEPVFMKMPSEPVNESVPQMASQEYRKKKGTSGRTRIRTGFNTNVQARKNKSSKQHKRRGGA